MRRPAIALGAVLVLALVAAAAASDDANDDEKDALAAAEATAKNQVAMRQFYAWLREHGVNTSALRITRLGRFGRGLQLRRGTVKKGDKLVDVPQKLWLTCKGHPLMDALPLVSDPDWWCLALRLLTERHNASSLWAPWLRILPEEQFLPWDIVQKDMRWYQSDDVHQWGKKAVEDLLRVYNHISSKDVIPAGAVTHSGLKWAAAMALTRRIPGIGIVPLLDFANHSPVEGREVTVKNKRAIMRAGTNAVAGQQLFVSYGDFDGRQLFLRYGFNIDVAEDHLDFKLPNNESAPESLKKWADAALDAYDIELEADDGSKPLFGGDKVNDRRISFRMDFWNRQNALLAYFRAMMLSEEDLQALDSGNKKITSPLSEKNERQARSFLYQTIMRALRQFPTEVWDDLRLLNQKIPDTQRTGVRMSVGFKLLLWRAANLLLPSVDEMAESERAREMKAAGMGQPVIETSDGRKLDVSAEELEAMQDEAMIPPGLGGARRAGAVKDEL